MSSHPKSLCEQNNIKANRSRVDTYTHNSATTTSGRPLSHEDPFKSPTKGPSQSRSRLQTSSLSGRASGTRGRQAEKENDTHDALGKSHSPHKETLMTTPKMSQTSLLPSTPAMRLPLADLVGNAEEAMRRTDEPKEQSPEEQIGWIANSSHPDLTPRQKRRRAQSSSPISSQEQAAKDSLDLKYLQQNLKTPRTISDPAAELWARYATARNPDGLDAKPPSFAHLIEPLSPRSGPRTPGGSVGGLRRWASCGMDFPASKAKKRRTTGVFRDRLEQHDKSETLPEKPVSRVGMLLEKVQASLAQPQHLRKDAPSSSSPLPDKADFTNLVDASPVQRRGRSGALQSRQHSQAEMPSQQSVRSMQSQLGREVMIDMDEFGDDDLDLDLEEAVQFQPDVLHHQQTLPSVSHASQQHQTDEQADQPEHFQPNQHALDERSNQAYPSQDVRMATIDEDSDEFGDDDLDISLEDMDTAVPMFASGSPSRTITPGAHSKDVSLNQTNYTTAAPNQEQRTNQAPVAQPKSSLVPVQQQVSVDLTGFADDDDDDDDFGGSDLDDDAFAQAEVTATQAAHQASGATSSSHTFRKSRAIQRYLVKQVIEGQYTNDKGRTMSEKVLLVEDEAQKRAKTITLRQSWFDTHCTAGSYVHVVGAFTSMGQITIDDAHNLLIVHPDHLISATVVADSFECIRRAVLQDRVKATSSANEYNVYGTILHEIFQEALKVNKWSSEWLDQLAETTLSKFLEKLFEIGHDGTGKALEHLRSKMPELKSWAEAFIRAKPGADALADDRNGKKVRMSITKLLDVEEHVWSPTYGLKGNIDATVQAVMQDEEGERSLTVPFEVKTGRNTSNTSHRAQTALYTLLLSDRYDIDVIFGVLYYMETSAVSRIPAIRNELRHMIMQRNELASYVRERLQLPPMLQNPHKCGRCYAKTQCFLYHKLAEGGTSETAGVKEKFDELVGKLQPAHQDFFKKWDDLLTKEESVMMKFRRELWTMLSKEREKLGRCFSEVVIEPGSGRENEDMAKINRFSYTFIKKESVSGFSFTESQITIGEPIVISSEQGHFALANGYVTKVSSRRISVAVDRRLHNARRKLQGFNSQTNQTFAGIMEVTKEDAAPLDQKETQVYRLDKDEFSNGMSTVRNNLLSIMDDNVYRSSELRALVVENRSPTFKPAPSKYNIPTDHMNPDQRAAIDKVMSAQDYALVLGMPGTGKTTTIAQIIRALVARGKSVLLTSYTHTAVDNILLKLRSPAGKKQGISILRLGTQSKIHPEVQDFATLAATPKHSLEEIQDVYMTPQVVATTCLGISHFLFQKRVFDYCIVDEASQITLPVCLGPIRMARTFVLVGDHYQLPPLVQNKEAAEGGLDVSLFKLLSDGHPEAVVELGRQYRMCEDIQVLSNTLIYSGKLQCGNQDVAERTLSLPNYPAGLERYHNRDPASAVPFSHNSAHQPCKGAEAPSCWLADVIHPARKVVFANTDTMVPTPRDTVSGPRIVNAAEATLVTQLVFALLASGVPGAEIGVITFYRSQLALLRQTAKAYAAGSMPFSASIVGTGKGAGELRGWEQVEMHTCDKFQGRDKEVVIVSCVRSNDAGNIGDLLKDWRRINVAVTRARSKLVMVGSAGTLANDGLLEKMMALLRERGWMRELGISAETEHVFEVGGTGASFGTPARNTPGKKKNVGLLLSPVLEEGEDEGELGEMGKKARKALTMRKGIDNFLVADTASSFPSAAGKENGNADVDDIENIVGAGGREDSTKQKALARPKQKPFKMPLKDLASTTTTTAQTKMPRKTGIVAGSKGLTAKMKKVGMEGNAVLADIVRDALGTEEDMF